MKYVGTCWLTSVRGRVTTQSTPANEMHLWGLRFAPLHRLKTDYGGVSSQNGNTPLHLACANLHLNVVDLLVTKYHPSVTIKNTVSLPWERQSWNHVWKVRMVQLASSSAWRSNGSRLNISALVVWGLHEFVSAWEWRMPKSTGWMVLVLDPKALMDLLWKIQFCCKTCTHTSHWYACEAQGCFFPWGEKDVGNLLKQY